MTRVILCITDKIRIFVLQTMKLSHLLRRGSKLFYLIMLDEKKRAFEKLRFVVRRYILRVNYNECLADIQLKRYKKVKFSRPTSISKGAQSLFLIGFLFRRTPYCSCYAQACVILNRFQFFFKQASKRLIVGGNNIVQMRSNESFVYGN